VATKQQPAEAQLINGHYPLTLTELECVASITAEQAKAMSALFLCIARLVNDSVVKDICEHGALQADLQRNDIDAMRERAEAAGFDASGVRHD
jgi:hypothetical protein